MISAKVELNHPLTQQRQFVAQTGSGHHMLLDDAAGGTGPKPIELVAAGLAGCTAFDVITILRLAGFKGSIDIEGWHDPVYQGELEMTGQVHGLNYLKRCRGGDFVPNPV